MSIKLLRLIIFSVTLLLSGLIRASAAAINLSTLPADQLSDAALPLRSSPVMFIENVGQFPAPAGGTGDDRARFQVRGGMGTMWLAEDAIWITVLERPDEETWRQRDKETIPLSPLHLVSPSPQHGVNLKLSFPGANPHPRIEPFDRLDTVISYFIGNDPDKWRPAVPVWGGVRYLDLYPGVDLELTGENGRWTWRLACRANCQCALRDVRLRVEGADAVDILPSPDVGRGAGGEGLRLTTAVGDFTLPLLALEGGAIQNGQAAALGLNLAEMFNVEHGVFEVTFPFSLSPVLPVSVSLQDNPDDLLYGTFLGGVSFSSGIAVDVDGSAYVVGWTWSGFPTTPGAFDISHNGEDDAFVAKVNPSGTGLIYATLLEGNWFECYYPAQWSQGCAVAIGGDGSAYLTGNTNSSDFPTTMGAYDTSYNGNSDVFVVKLNSSGTELAYSTFLGGNRNEYVARIAVDGEENVYVAGFTDSTNFPTTPGAYSTSHNGGWDAFVIKLNASGNSLTYATLVGGSGTEWSSAIAVDGAGNAYVTGATLFTDFPSTPGAFDTTHNGGLDAFVVKLNASGSSLAYATFLGGSNDECWYSYAGYHAVQGCGITIDENGNAYIAGTTDSSNFPASPGAFDTSYNGYSDAFAAKLNASGTGLIYATFLGGAYRDLAFDIAVDLEGSAYLLGRSEYNDYPTTPGAYDTSHNGDWDAVITKLNASGNILAYSTFLGKSGAGLSAADFFYGHAIAVDGAGNAYVTGEVGYANAFVGKLAMGVGRPPTRFLDLPFDYGDSVPIFVQALQDADDGGRVNSWFDHAYPDYGKNGRLVLYDGRARTTKNLYNPNLGCYERRCYDGHNGLDFTYVDPQPEVAGSQDLPIFPAAAGRVVVAQLDSGGDYGNHVIVDHQNSYFTRYAHLKVVYVSQGITVTSSDTLGIMGSTGRTFGGTHLHFGVYRDNGNGQWDGESVDKPVDPYGWKGDSADPWVADRQGLTSYYLWIHKLATQDTVSGAQETTMTDLTGRIEATIPPGAFSGQATLELSPGLVAGSSAQLRSSGHPFWLRLLEWLPDGGGLQAATALQTITQFTLTHPITLTVTYTDTDVPHLDVTQLVLYHWDEDQGTWQPLPTMLDPANHMAIAQTEDLGDFDLQAPLLCGADGQESDDGYAVAQWVWPNDWPLARGLDIPQDRDWARFDAIQGARYTIRTQNLAGGADTELNLYDVDALTLMVSNDDIGGGPASELVWTAPYTGTFFIETISAPGGTTGCSATYELTITTILGDVVADCRVDIADLQAVASRWRISTANPDPDDDPATPNYETRFDLDGDGDVDAVDIMRVANLWGETCL